MASSWATSTSGTTRSNRERQPTGPNTRLLTGRRSLAQVPAYVYATSGVIMTMPWSFKFFFGMINDCFPIGGYR